jgi:hypothetical protein
MKKVKNRMNKSEQSSLDTIDNEYSNKINFILENNYNNSLSIAKNSFHINSNSAIFLKRKNKNNISSCFNSNYLSKYDKNISTIFKKRYKNRNNISKFKNKSYTKISLKPKKEFRIDRENFAKNYINKKIFLDKYCNEEIKFHRKLLSSKSCELECTKEPNEFDLKKSKRDADLAFNKIFELCKSSNSKKNIANFLKQRNFINGGINGNLTTSSEKKMVYSLYDIFKGNKKEEDRKLDEKEKKYILLNNEEKMKQLNMEYEQMIHKEGELKEKKIKLLEEIMKK